MEESFEQRRPKERRHGPDVWVKAIRWLALAGWLLFSISLYLYDRAKPDFETFFDRWFGIQVRTHWNEQLAFFSLMLFIVCLVTSLVALVINRNRHRRKSDEYRINLIVLSAISFLGIAGYLMLIF